MSDLARVAPAPAAKKKGAPAPAAKKNRAPTPAAKKKKKRAPPPPPSPSSPPPRSFVLQFPPQPRPQRPPSFKLCKRCFQSTESFPRPSCEHCVCKRWWREGCTPPDPPPPLKPCQLASQHMNPVQAYHVSIGFANGGGAAPPPTPPLLKAMPACFKAKESFPSPS